MSVSGLTLPCSRPLPAHILLCVCFWVNIALFQAFTSSHLSASVSGLTLPCSRPSPAHILLCVCFWVNIALFQALTSSHPFILLLVRALLTLLTLHSLTSGPVQVLSGPMWQPTGMFNRRATLVTESSLTTGRHYMAAAQAPNIDSSTFYFYIIIDN